MNTKQFIISLSICLLIASSVTAQPTTQKTSLTIGGAKKAIAAAVAQAKKGAGTAAIAVVDEGGNLVAVERLDNTFAAGSNLSIGKARTAVMFKKPTRELDDIINKSRTAMATPNDFTSLQGGIPIIVDGQVIGGIGVSGAANAQQDEEISLAGANALTGAPTMPAPPYPVTFVGKQDVAAAFARGAQLLDTAGRNYRVSASRRIAPGEVEIHAIDTDLIYVVSGEATFVTGGKVVDQRQTSPIEVRGTRIEGGTPRNLAAGDFILVPPGTPHWFSQVKSEFRYYIIKVN